MDATSTFNNWQLTKYCTYWKLTTWISVPPVKPSLWLLSSPFYGAEKLHLSHWNLNPCEQPPYDFSVSPSLMQENHTCHNTKFHSSKTLFMTPKFPFYATEKLHLLHWILHPYEQPPYEFSVSPSLLPGNHTSHNNTFHPCEIFFINPKFPLLCCWEITLVTLKSPSLWTVSNMSLQFLHAARKPHLSQ